MTAVATRGLPMLRAWHGDHIRRGATVEYRVSRYRGDAIATVLSAQGANVAIRVFATGERLIVKPFEIGPVQ